MSEWQPIETAPKDGTSILVWDKEDGCQYVAQHIAKKWLVTFGCDSYYNYYCMPSRWMPLPTPPES